MLQNWFGVHNSISEQKLNNTYDFDVFTFMFSSTQARTHYRPPLPRQPLGIVLTFAPLWPPCERAQEGLVASNLRLHKIAANRAKVMEAFSK